MYGDPRGRAIKTNTGKKKGGGCYTPGVTTFTPGKGYTLAQILKPIGKLLTRGFHLSAPTSTLTSGKKTVAESFPIDFNIGQSV